MDDLAPEAKAKACERQRKGLPSIYMSEDIEEERRTEAGRAAGEAAGNAEATAVGRRATAQHAAVVRAEGSTVFVLARRLAQAAAFIRRCRRVAAVSREVVARGCRRQAMPLAVVPATGTWGLS